MRGAEEPGKGAHAKDGPRRPEQWSLLLRALYESVRAEQRYATELAKTAWATWNEGPSHTAANPVQPAPKDWRFTHPVWSANPYFHLLQQNHLLAQRCVSEIVEALPLGARERGVAQGVAQFVADALAPTNFPAGNPAALRTALDTGGRSLLAGARNFLSDITAVRRLPPLTDLGKFVKGRDVAATEGSVVYRNRIMEVIQYKAKTGSVFSTPILVSPPWVNRYYIADIAPGQSIVESLLDRGHTIFTMSYRNPDASLRDVGFDTYMREALIPALDVIEDVTGAGSVNLVGACVGGVLALMMAAWEADEKRKRISTVTLINSLIDFSDFTETLDAGYRRELVESLFLVADRLMEAKGYVEGKNIDNFFRFLRPNELVWPQVVTSWLLGRESPEHAVLAWSSDSINVAYRAQRYLLRDLVMRNALARGEAVFEGKRLRLDRVRQDVFISAAREDHIIPWKSAYRTAALLPGDVRFHLVSGGHILGSATPPRPRTARYWTADHRMRPDPVGWFADAVEHRSSWWSAWGEWLDQRAGARRSPPRTGSSRYPELEKAPGSYVHT
ncbi:MULTISPECIES: PHA/PHB synthase family protein [Streptomyces]|uniref:PHA/PHB synthase family protein n=1 Tax=Streptomyces TaxID=1883 RepID=UPI00224901BE|nr:alpha/beta fold hydrolase [Streptomyces sp. JHD 1]MCX2968719.1 alpha/beta fold hydrolase [Streptomyces sp. JHD 1]